MSEQIISGTGSEQFMLQKSTCVLEPPDIFLDDHIIDLKFSPVANVLALGQVNGDVRIYSYGENEMKE